MTLPLFAPPAERLRVAVTANRDLTPRDVLTIDARAADLCALDPEEVILGGARGGDTEMLVAVARHRDPARTRLVVVVPCRLVDQPREAQAAVRRCLGPGDDLVELGLTITAADRFEAFKARNRRMVDRGTHCLGFWDGDRRSGTWSCLAYALRLARPVWVEPIEGGDGRRPTTTPAFEGDHAR